MHFIFAAIRLFPFWAIPLGLVLLQISLFFHRRKESARFLFIGFSLLFLGLSVFWILMRGDLHANQWVRTMTGWPIPL